MKSTTVLPRARVEGLIVNELADETLVYDLERNKAHCLNRRAALVWKQCVGNTTFMKATRSVRGNLNVPVDADLIWLAVKELKRFHLVEGATRSAAVSRRELMLKYAPATLALPVIISIVAPTPAQGASPCSQPTNRADGCPCTDNSQCQGENCSGGICQTL